MYALAEAVRSNFKKRFFTYSLAEAVRSNFKKLFFTYALTLYI